MHFSDKVTIERMVTCLSVCMQLLLDLAWAIFEQQTNVATLIYRIMLHTQSLLLCERCQVMLVDETGKAWLHFHTLYIHYTLDAMMTPGISTRHIYYVFQATNVCENS